MLYCFLFSYFIFRYLLQIVKMLTSFKQNQNHFFLIKTIRNRYHHLKRNKISLKLDAHLSAVHPRFLCGRRFEFVLCRSLDVRRHLEPGRLIDALRDLRVRPFKVGQQLLTIGTAHDGDIFSLKWNIIYISISLYVQFHFDILFCISNDNKLTY